MRIGELARRTGVSERALRYYEKQGLLSPARTQSGYRAYGEDALNAVRQIRILLAAGLSTTQILEVMPCIVDDGAQLAPGCPELADGLSLQRNRLDTAIGELRATRDNLDKIITSTPHRL